MTQAEAFPELTPDLRARFVTQVADTVRELYVFEDKANEMADHILAQLENGAFEEVASIPNLAARMTQELHSVHEDLHLYIDPWLPQGDESDAGNLHEETLVHKRLFNYDFRKAEVLLGNIGYLDLRSFCPVRMSGETAAAAMKFLSNTDALIIDLRDNGGGEDLVQFLQSYLFSEPTHMLTQRHRSGRARQTWTHPYVPGPKLIDQPVYVLISKSTFSAGEDFAFTLQRQGRVTVIGEQTRGGAHPVEFHRFPELYLEIMIPEECSEDPISGENWEDTGVIPDIAVHADDALDVAHADALKKLAARTTDDPFALKLREWALESVAARPNRPALTPEQLKTYEGEYGRSLRVFLDGTVLRLSWGGRRDYVLHPLFENVFEFEDGCQRVEFAAEDGAISHLIWREHAGGEWTMTRKT